MILEIKSFQVLVNEFFKNRILAECMELWLFFSFCRMFFKKYSFLNSPSFKCVSRSYIIE